MCKIRSICLSRYYKSIICKISTFKKKAPKAIKEIRKFAQISYGNKGCETRCEVEQASTSGAVGFEAFLGGSRLELLARGMMMRKNHIVGSTVSINLAIVTCVVNSIEAIRIPHTCPLARIRPPVGRYVPPKVVAVVVKSNETNCVPGYGFVLANGPIN